MKSLLKTGLVYLDLESYGITGIQVSESATEVGVPDTGTGGTYTGLSGSKQYSFTFSMFINSNNIPPKTGVSYPIFISTESFAYMGTGRLTSVQRSGELDDVIAYSVNGYFDGAVTEYGPEIMSNTTFNFFTNNLATGFTLDAGTPTKQVLNDRYFQRIQCATAVGNFGQAKANYIPGIEPLTGDTATTIINYYISTEIEQTLRSYYNGVDYSVLSIGAGDKRLSFVDQVLTNDLGNANLRIDNTGGSSSVNLDIYYWSLRKKII